VKNKSHIKNDWFPVEFNSAFAHLNRTEQTPSAQDAPDDGPVFWCCAYLGLGTEENPFEKLQTNTLEGQRSSPLFLQTDHCHIIIISLQIPPFHIVPPICHSVYTADFDSAALYPSEADTLYTNGICIGLSFHPQRHSRKYRAIWGTLLRNIRQGLSQIHARS
jgi:hypothetical protein